MRCTSEHSLLLYHQQRQLMKEEEPSLELLYDTATTALCIGKITVGMNLLSDLIEEYKSRHPKQINPEEKQIFYPNKQISPENRKRAQAMMSNIALTKWTEQMQRALETSSPGFFTRDKTSVLVPILKDRFRPDVYEYVDFTPEIEGFILIDSETIEN